MVPASSVTEEERARVLGALWRQGGLPFLGSFYDVLLSEESNALVAEFVRGKIREVVKDPKTAELLCPKGIIGCKRMCVDTDYYETFNRPNVSLVNNNPADRDSTPIQRVTPRGLLTSDGTEYEVDAIVFAIGFDAMTGALLGLNVVGEDGRRLEDAWRDGPGSFLGLGVCGFPNLFTVTGPGSPSVLTNMLPAIEQHVDWIADALVHLRTGGLTRMAVDQAAQDRWMSHGTRVVAPTLRASPACSSWYTGDNVPGKPRVMGPYAGGVDRYTRVLRRVREDGYSGFLLS